MNNQPQSIQHKLKTWFTIHFVVDVLVAIPLLFFPAWLAGLLGLEVGSTFPLQILGAAFFAIGTHSLLMRNARLSKFQTFLQFKILWSSTAMFACFLALIDKPQAIVVATLVIFLCFFFIWNSFLYKVNVLLKND